MMALLGEWLSVIRVDADSALCCTGKCLMQKQKECDRKVNRGIFI